MVSNPAKDQKANHCKKLTMDCGKYCVTCEGSGSVTTMIGRKIALYAISEIRDDERVHFTGMQ